MGDGTGLASIGPMAKGNAKKARKRLKRATATRRKVKVKLKTAKRKQAAAPPPPRPPRDERRRQGAHYTPMSMCDEVVAKALYPHLLWMAQDPEAMLDHTYDQRESEGDE